MGVGARGHAGAARRDRHLPGEGCLLGELSVSAGGDVAPTSWLSTLSHYGSPDSAAECSRRSTTSATPMASRSTLLLVTYVHLWVLEGVIRKWVLPEATNIVYVARDGLFVCAAALVLTRRRRAPWSAVEFLIACAVAVLTALTVWQVMAARVAPTLGLLGLRSYAIALVVALFALRVRDEIDLTKVMWAVVTWLPVTAAVSVAQGLSAQDSFINQVGQDQFEALSTADGVARASGTFTASLGLSVYTLLALAAALALAGEQSSLSFRDRRSVMIMVCLASSFVVVAVAGSRTLLAGAVMIAVGYAALVPERRPQYKAGLLVLAAVAASSTLLFAPSTVDAFQSRIQTAGEQEDGTARLLTTATQYSAYPEGIPILGDGAGTHSSAGRSLNRGLQWIELDNPRSTQELGIVGVLFTLVKQGFAVVAILLAWSVRHTRDGRRALLFSLALLPVLLFGQITVQPSAQGFAAVGFALYAVAAAAGRRAA